MVRAGVSEEVTSVQKGTMVGRTWGRPQGGAGLAPLRNRAPDFTGYQGSCDSGLSFKKLIRIHVESCTWTQHSICLSPGGCLNWAGMREAGVSAGLVEST